MDNKINKPPSTDCYKGREETAKILEIKWKEKHYKIIWESIVRNSETSQEMTEQIREEFETVCREFDKATDVANDVSMEPGRENEAWEEYYFNEEHFYPYPVSILNWMIEDAKNIFPDHDWDSLREELDYTKEETQK